MRVGGKEPGGSSAFEMQNMAARAGDFGIICPILVNSPAGRFRWTIIDRFSRAGLRRIRVIMIKETPVAYRWIVDIVGNGPIQEEVIRHNDLSGQWVCDIA